MLCSGQRFVAQHLLQVLERHSRVVYLRGERLAEAVQVPLLTDWVLFARKLRGALHLGNTVPTVQTCTQCNALQNSEEVPVGSAITVRKNQLAVTSLLLPFTQHADKLFREWNLPGFVTLRSKAPFRFSAHYEDAVLEVNV